MAAGLYIAGLFEPWIHVHLSPGCIWRSYSTGPFHTHSAPIEDGPVIVVGVALLAIAALTGFGRIKVGNPTPWLTLEIISGGLFLVLGMGIASYRRPGSPSCTSSVSSAPGTAFIDWGLFTVVVAILALPIGVLVRRIRRGQASRRAAVTASRSREEQDSRSRSLDSLHELVLEMRALNDAQLNEHQHERDDWFPPPNSPEAMLRLALNRRLEARLATLGDRFGAASPLQKLAHDYRWDAHDLEAAVHALAREEDGTRRQ